jgi:hypothetical protein
MTDKQITLFHRLSLHSQTCSHLTENKTGQLTYLLSLCEIVPFSNFDDIEARTLHASFAKSRSRTSIGETDINAKASLSSLTVAHPT